MKGKLVVEFLMENDSFNGDDNFHWELRMIADKITRCLDIYSIFDAKDVQKTLHDTNGNRIGEISLTFQLKHNRRNKDQ